MLRQSLKFLLFFFIFSGGVSTLNAQKLDSVRINNSIEKGVQYLNRRIASDSIYYLGVPLLVPVSQYYSIKLDPAIYSTDPKISDDREKQIFRLYSSMFKRIALDEKNLPDLFAIDLINLFPIYGEKICSEKTFLYLLDSATGTKSYELSHAYLAIQMIKKTGRSVNNPVVKLEKNLERKMKLALRQSGNKQFTDLEIEILAMNLYGGLKVNASKIIQLIHQQSPDGSWEQQGNTSAWQRDHSTILAIWALLEWKFIEDKTLYLPALLQSEM